MRFFRGALLHLRIHISLVARFEGTDKTGKLPPYVSAVMSFAPRLIGSPVKGSRQLCCRGVELRRTSQLSTISYQLSAAAKPPGFVGNFDTGLPEIYVSVGVVMRL